MFADDAISSSSLGYSVDVSATGTLMIAGAPGALPSAAGATGAAYIFSVSIPAAREGVRVHARADGSFSSSNAPWQQLATLYDASGSAQDKFGYGVAMSDAGDLVAVLAPDAGGGIVYVYAGTDGGATWQLEQKIEPPSGFSFGAAAIDVSGDGSTLGVTAQGNGTHTFIYTRSAGQWAMARDVVLDVDAYAATQMQLSSNGSVFVAGTSTSVYACVCVSACAVAAVSGYSGLPVSLAADGASLLASATVYAWRFGSWVPTWSGMSSVYESALSGDGRTLALLDGDNANVYMRVGSSAWRPAWNFTLTAASAAVFSLVPVGGIQGGVRFTADGSTLFFGASTGGVNGVYQGTVYAALS